MPVPKIWGNSIHEQEILQSEGSQVRLVERKAITEVRSDPAGVYATPLQEDLWMGDGLTTGMIPLCSAMGEEGWSNCSRTLPHFATALLLVCTEALVLNILKDQCV